MPAWLWRQGWGARHCTGDVLAKHWLSRLAAESQTKTEETLLDEKQGKAYSESRADLFLGHSSKSAYTWSKINTKTSADSKLLKDQ